MYTWLTAAKVNTSQHVKVGSFNAISECLATETSCINSIFYPKNIRNGIQEASDGRSEVVMS